MKKAIVLIVAIIIGMSGCYQVSNQNYTTEEAIEILSQTLSENSSRKEWIDHDEEIKIYFGQRGEKLKEYVEVLDESTAFIESIIAYYDYEDTSEIYPFKEGAKFPSEDEVLMYKDNSSFDELNLAEIRDLASKLFVDDSSKEPYVISEEYIWHADGAYTLLSGRCHWTKFFMVYDENGDYVTGHTWSDKVFHRPSPIYYEVQNAYGVGKRCFNSGTGVHLTGNRLFQLYKNKLINVLDYPTKGYDSFRGHNIWFEYDVVEEFYDQTTGDITVDYVIVIKDETTSYMTTEIRLVYKWLGDAFEYADESFFDILENRVIYPAVINKLIEDDMKGLKAFISGEAYAVKELIGFLEEAPDSNEKERLLNELKDTYKKASSQNDNIEVAVKKLNQTLSENSPRAKWIDHDEEIKNYFGQHGEKLKEYLETLDESTAFIESIIAYYDYEDVTNIYPFSDEVYSFPNEEKVQGYMDRTSFDELNLLEIKDLASKLFVDDAGEAPYILYDEYQWHADRAHTLLSGRCHWTKFFMVYDENGDYVTGHTWSDKVFHRPAPIYYELQNAYGVGKVCFDYGTGVTLYGNKLLKIYSDKLVDDFAYPTSGFMLLNGHNIQLEYDVIEAFYDQTTGDITVDYAIVIKDETTSYMTTEIKLVYKWLGDAFEYANESFFDILENRVIYPAVINTLIEDDMKGLEVFISGEAYAVEELVYFLERAPDGNEKDALLNALNGF